jgi:hypothetical protein
MFTILIYADMVGQKVTDAGDRSLSAKWPFVVFAGLCLLPAIDVLVRAAIA